MAYRQQVNYWFLVPVALAAAAASILLLFLPYGEEIYWFNQYRIEPFNTLGQYITKLGEWFPWVAAIGYFIWAHGRFARALAICSILLLLVSFSLKSVAQRERPGTWVTKNTERPIVFVPEVYVNKASTSYPSGHTFSAFTLFILLAQMAGYYSRPKWGLLFAILAILTACSRVFLVQHFLADVIAGAVIGMMFGLATWWAWLKWDGSE